MIQSTCFLCRLFGSLVLFGFLVGACKSDTESGQNPYQLPLIMTTEAYQNLVANNSDMTMVDLGTIDSIRLDIRYATTNNFTGEIIYTLPRAFVRKPVAEALAKIQDSLASYHLALKIYDAYRPYAATLKFYEVYPDTNFVANPRYGSRHNRGCAVDLTLVERTSGKEIPMPTEFDDFSERAHPDYSNFSDTILANRSFLFSIMEHFGLTHYPTEWWHFDYVGWEDYPLMDLSFEELLSAGLK